MNKPRLIDANTYLEKVCTYKETGCGSCKFQTCCPKDQPTAYDINEVVEQIENNYFAPGKCVSFIGKSDAIEIVKKGGAE